MQFERLTAEDYEPQGEFCLRATVSFRQTSFSLIQLPEGRRRLVEHRHALAPQQFVESRRVTAHRERDDHHPPAVEQRAPQFPDGEVEGVRMKERPYVALVETEPRAGRVEETCNVGVADRDALRLARRAGGVDDVGQVRRRGGARRIFGALARNRFSVSVEANHSHTTLRHARE